MATVALVPSVIGSAIGFFNSLVAMVIGATTGAANLLTNWLYWAIDYPTYANYAGLFWLSLWIIGFAYIGYEIATSDGKTRKSWKNAVGKGSTYVGFLLCLFLVAQPIIVSYGATYLADQTVYNEIDYNVTEATDDANYKPFWSLKNATSTYLKTQTATFDNDTSSQIISSTAHDDISSIGTVTENYFGFRLNTTVFANSTISKITVSWVYVGTGNLTGLRFQKSLPVFAWIEAKTSIFGESSYDWIPETFESAQLKSITKMSWMFYFDDSVNAPSAGDYFEISIKFYESTTLFTSAMITEYLAWALGTINLLLVMYLSKAYKHIAKRI